jgi:hypothetical protein
MLDLAQEWVKLAEQSERNDQYRLAEQSERNDQYRVSGYRAKAWECMSLAESINDPERRADLLLFGRLWMSLTEPLRGDLRGAYELPSSPGPP